MEDDEFPTAHRRLFARWDRDDQLDHFEDSHGFSTTLGLRELSNEFIVAEHEAQHEDA